MPSKVEEFRKALKEKEINIADLINMSSEARTELLKEYAGDSAKDVNLLFERKLVLKNKIQGIKNWSSKLGEIGRYSPKKSEEIKKALQEFEDKQFERTFSPKEEESFLSDLVEKEFGTSISKEEASNVFSLTEKVNELKSGYDETTQQWKSPEDRLRYGSAKVILENYIKELKEENLPIKEQIKGRISEFKQTYKENKVKSVTDVLGDSLKALNDNVTAFVASIDNSFLGRQGLNTLKTHPSAWWVGAKNSFKDIYTTIAKKDGDKMAEDTLWSDIYSEPNYLNGNYEKAKLLPKIEEQYPSTLPEKIPLLGKAFKASEVAFKGSAIRMRTKLFDLLSETAKKNGVEMDDVQIKDIGKLINSVTARGESKILDSELSRAILWAPKMLKANIDILTAHGLGSGLETKFARQQSFKNLGKIAAETIGLAVIINSIRPNTVELDSRSSDFLKPKFANTRFDITGGLSSLIVLISRLVSGMTKTASGEIKKINTGGYGEGTLFDTGVDFIVNKMTPLNRTIVDFARGTDANFQPTTIKGEFLNKLPISVQNFYKLNEDNSAPAVIGAFLDLLGINASTYKAKVKETELQKKGKLKSKLKPLKKL